MKAPLSKLSLRWLPVLAPWAVLVVGLAATAALAVSTHREMTARDAERFSHEVDQLVATVDSHLRRYGQALMGLRDWYAIQVTHGVMYEKLWTNYVYALQAPAHYPGLFDVGFAEFVMDSILPETPVLDRHLKAIRERLGPGYNLRLPPGGIENSGWYHLPVIWHSYGQWRGDPIREYRHYGMDLNQNPDLRTAMNWALGQDVPALSGKSQIDPDELSLDGLMIFLPVYDQHLDRNEPLGIDSGGWLNQPEAAKNWRRHTRSLRGLIFGGINVQAFFERHLGTNAPTVTFALYASTNQLPGELSGQLLFDNRVQRSNQTAESTMPSSTVGAEISDRSRNRHSSLSPRTHPLPLPGGQLARAEFNQAPLLGGVGGGFRVSMRENVFGKISPREGRAEGVAARTSKSSRSMVRDLPLYGRNLRFVLEPGPAFASALNRRTLGLTAGFGVVTTLLLSGFIAYQARANRKEREIASALRLSENRLQTMLHERERMSRDLHDGTIQSLYAIGLGLGRLRRTLNRSPERERLEASLVELDHVVAELRSYLVTLDPGVSPAQSAATALAELVARLRQTAATELRFTADAGVGEGWPPAAVLDLLLAAREGVSNALRHGHATQVELALQQAGRGEVHFTLTDHGKGFDPSATERTEGHGLANLERRARAWNGWLHVESRLGGPTRLTLALFPLGQIRPPPPATGTLNDQEAPD